jgi:hypothetical protein
MPYEALGGIANSYEAATIINGQLTLKDEPELSESVATVLVSLLPFLPPEGPSLKER